MALAARHVWNTALPVGALPAVAVAAGLGTGVVLAAGAEAGHEAALIVLLRFMAVVKAVMVLGVAAATTWRLRTPAAPGTVAAYATACAIMAAGLWPIWAGGPVALAAALVHGGFVLAALAAWRDRAGWQATWGKPSARPKLRPFQG